MAFLPATTFRAWEPDADPREPGILVDTDGFFGTARGLRTLPSWVLSEVTLPDRCLGAYNAMLPDGNNLTFAGTREHLYRLLGDDTREEFDGAQTFTTTRRWRFATFGYNVIAVNGVDPPQVSQFGEPFQPLAGVSDVDPVPIVLPGDTTSPGAAYVAVVDEGVFLVPADSDRWFFSTAHTIWTPSIANGVANARLVGTAGPITAIHRIRGGVVICKESSLYFGQYIGAPFFWQFDSVSENVGVPSHEAIVNASDVLLLMSRDDFYSFDGSSLQRLPNQFKEYFFRTLTTQQLARVIGRYDPINSLAIWHYPTSAESDSPLDEMLIFNLRTGKWTRSTLRSVTGEAIGAEAIVLPSLVQGPFLSYEEFENTYGTYEAIPDITYDSEALARDGDLVVGGIITNAHTLATANGPPAGGYLTTGEIGDSTYYYQLNRVRPVFAVWPSDNRAKLSAYMRTVNGYPIPDPNPFPQPGIGDEVWLGRDGAFSLFQTARAHQFKLEVFGTCEITGFVLDGVQVGSE